MCTSVINHFAKFNLNVELKNDIFQCCFFVELNKTNEVKFWLNKLLTKTSLRLVYYLILLIFV